jgi:hypothetical protein
MFKGNGAPEEIRTPDPQIRSLFWRISACLHGLPSNAISFGLTQSYTTFRICDVRPISISPAYMVLTPGLLTILLAARAGVQVWSTKNR